MEESLIKRHEPLYLKYRPQSLNELVGQESVKRTLINAIEHNRLTHAYLFTGPRGTGKTSTARILAKSLNCKSAGRPTVEPCQTCSCCTEITRNISPAVFELDAASNNSVDDARQLIERAPLKAVAGEYKVYIIDECHMLTKEAFNALLKTIEQPPPQVVFILATTEEHKVIPTIVSRCQRLIFRLIEQDVLAEHLQDVAAKEKIEIEKEAVQLIARRSGGGLRDALSNLDQSSLLSAPGNPVTVSDLLKLLGALNEDRLLQLSSQIAARQGLEVTETIKELLHEGKEPQIILQELAKHFLNLTKTAYLSGKSQTDPEGLSSIILGSQAYLEGLVKQYSLFELAELSQIIEHLDRLEQTVRRSTQPAMQLEIGLLSICHRQDIHLLKDLSARLELLERKLAGQDLPINTQSSQISPLKTPVQQTHAKPEPQGRETPQEASAHVQSVAKAQDHLASRSRQEAEAEKVSGQEQEQVHTESMDRSSPTAPEAAPQTASASSETFEQESQSDKKQKTLELSADLDSVWQEILDELKRRHLPTFSLTSTHAFPIGIDAKELTVGVMKESFQKMLETKSEHIRTACEAATGLKLLIKIKVADSSIAPVKKTAQVAAALSSSRNREAEPDTSRDRELPLARQEASTQQELENDLPAQANVQTQTPQSPLSKQEMEHEHDATMVKEAYKLFEGPGSRRIT